MSVIRIATRYAKSLIDLAQEQNKLDRILEDIESFQEATNNRDFYLLLKSPIINTDKKLEIFRILFDESFDELTMAFMDIILKKGREQQLPEIAAEFIAQYKEINHIQTVKLTTAQSLSEEVVERIKSKLEDSKVTDDHIEIVTAVDPELIGGFVLEFDNRLYDASVAHKLDQLKKDFSKNDFLKKY